MTPIRTRRRRLAAAVPALVLALLASACSGEDADPPQTDPAPSLQEPGEAPTLAVEPVTRSGRLVGRLPRKDRARVEQAVTRVAVRWMDDAYLGGRYPRKSFGSSFSVFTPGARAAARQDLGRLTNKMVGRRVDAVTPTAVRVGVDLLAVRERAVTATAHVELRFRTEGDLERHYRVAGRLMMTRQPPGWRVFAYDIARAQLGKGASGAPTGKQGRPDRPRGEAAKRRGRDEGGRA